PGLVSNRLQLDRKRLPSGCNKLCHQAKIKSERPIRPSSGKVKLVNFDLRRRFLKKTLKQCWFNTLGHAGERALGRPINLPLQNQIAPLPLPMPWFEINAPSI